MSDVKEPVHWPRLALLDVLRPPQGWHATDVLLSTYSLDLAVLVSGLLALTGKDTVEGSGSKVGLAYAIHHFRPDGPNRLATLVQGGRITMPRTNSKVLALLDRFVCEIKQDQRRESWHAKVALVRFVPGPAAASDSSVEWRVWIGSRNLTRDMSWDAGLVLCSSDQSTQKTSQQIEGVDAMARALLGETGWDKIRQHRLLAEIKQQHWHTPENVKIQSIAWLDGHSSWLPTFPRDMDELVVITPFFDKKSLRVLENVGGKAVSRTLLTTQMELDRQLAGAEELGGKWSVVCLESSEQGLSSFTEADDGVNALGHEPEPLGSEDEDAPIGLHAKIIAARRGSEVWMTLGSANITQRAWLRNTEVVITLEGGDKLLEGIKALLGLAGHAELHPLHEQIGKDEQHLLEDFRNSLCNLQLQQLLGDGTVDVSADQSPEKLMSAAERKQWQALGVRFAVAPLGCAKADFIRWLPDQSTVSLPRHVHSLAGESELLCFRLSVAAQNMMRGESEVHLSWVQRVPMTPPPDRQRDRRILAGYLSPGQFLSWITGMLEGYESDNELWADERNQRGPQTARQGRMKQRDLPSIEALLRAWQRDPRSLEQVADTLERYFDAKLLKSYNHLENSPEVEMLDSFRRQLKQIGKALGASGS